MQKFSEFIDDVLDIIALGFGLLIFLILFSPLTAWSTFIITSTVLAKNIVTGEEFSYLWIASFLIGSAVVATLLTRLADALPWSAIIVLLGCFTSIGTFFGPLFDYLLTGHLSFPRLFVLGIAIVVMSLTTLLMMMSGRVRAQPKNYSLQTLRQEDKSQFVNLLMAESVRPFELGTKSADDAATRFDELIRLSKTEYVRTIRPKKNEEKIIGLVTVKNRPDHKDKEFTLLIRPNFWWKASAVRASHDVLEEVFVFDPETKVVAESTKADIDKYRFLKRLGFKRIRDAKEKWNSVARFEVTKEDFERHLAKRYWNKVLIGIEEG